MPGRKTQIAGHGFTARPALRLIVSTLLALSVHACGSRAEIAESTSTTKPTSGDLFAGGAGNLAGTSGTLGNAGVFGGAPAAAIPGGASVPRTACIPGVMDTGIRSFTTGANPTSIAVGDWNGDGFADFATANQLAGTVSILLSCGDGTFTQRTDYGVGTGPYALASCDLNGDGKADLISANGDEKTLTVLVGRGDGTFIAIGKYDADNGGGPQAVACADLNNDGMPDVAVLNRQPPTVSVLLGASDATLAPKVDFETGSNPYALAIGDLNGDGKRDIVTGNRSSSNVSTLLGRGDGTLFGHVDHSDPESDGTRTIAIGDLNGDAQPDLGLGDLPGRGPSGSFGMMPGRGDGTFGAAVDYPPSLTACQVATADLDNDGRLDLVGSTYPGISVLLGQPGGSLLRGNDFRVASGGTCALGTGDVNGDGKLDLVLSSGTQRVSVLLGAGDGSFR